MTSRAEVIPSKAWLAGVVAAFVLAVASTLVAGCSVNVPLGVDPKSDAVGEHTDAGAGN